MKAFAVLLTVAAVALTGCRKKPPTPKPDAAAPDPSLSGAPVPGKATGGTMDIKEDPNMAFGTFLMAKGRMPTNMQEMVTEKFLRAVPAAPPGKKYAVDPKAGRVVLVPE
ncbi:MAG: hypothetical protein ABMA26_17770 [Limisphaerales bacterium]